MNGSPLTILSMLARLGKDPWAEAARLARLPKSSTVDDLANSIFQDATLSASAPGCPQHGRSAYSSAAVASSNNFQRPFPASWKVPLLKWVPLAAFLAIVAFGIGFQMMGSGTSTGTVTPLVEQTLAHPRALAN